ncbi:MAG: hypothetical protein K8J08_05730 [Thermoanaerobaculia bacterium]|nr:hypothetical protein [Thermoanaerobaculia bacterium]
MRRRILFAGLVLAIGYPGSGFAGPIEDLLELDGTETLLLEIAPTLEQTVRAQLDGLDPPPTFESARLMNRFSANRLRRRMTEILGTSWRIEPGGEIRTWFDSELGREIRAAERSLASEESKRLMGVYVGTLGDLGPEDERWILADRILEARRDVERLERIQRTAVALSLSILNEGVSGEEVEEEVETALDDLRPELQQRARWRVLFTHRTLGNEAMRQHAEFLEGEAARWYFRRVNEVLGRALDEALDDFESPSSAEVGN